MDLPASAKPSDNCNHSQYPDSNLTGRLEVEALSEASFAFLTHRNWGVANIFGFKWLNFRIIYGTATDNSCGYAEEKTGVIKHKHSWSEPCEIALSVGHKSVIPYGSTDYTGALPTYFISDLDAA